MTPDREKFVRMLFQALQNWFASMGEYARVLFGLALIVAFFLLFTLVVRMVRLGLNRCCCWNFSRRRELT